MDARHSGEGTFSVGLSGACVGETPWSRRGSLMIEPLTVLESGGVALESAARPTAGKSTPPHPTMHGDDAAGEVTDADLIEACCFDPAGERATVGPGEDRVREVLVGGR